jgi:EpsD family peptidyl-prolyl cis-trans isomerase
VKKIISILVILVIFLSGCTSRPEGEKGRGAAVVNGVEITQGEVDFFAKKSISPGTGETEAFEQRKAILASLVRMELLAQKARELKVDKDPEYTIALYEAQRQVLAGMAEARLIKNMPSISAETAKEVVANNPRLFSDRQLLVYDEILIQGVDVPFLNTLISMVDSGATEGQLLEKMKSQNKVFQKTTKSVTSDQIQPGILEVLLKSKLGHPIVARVEDKFSMIMLLHLSLPVPVQGEQATRAIMSMAYSQERNKILLKNQADMINSSKITYYGEYAKNTIGDQKTTGLPSPDMQSASRKTFKSIGFGVILSVSLTFAILVLTVSMRILSGKLWLPRLWPSSNIKDEGQKALYDWDYEAYSIEKIYIGFIALVILSVFGIELYLLNQYLPLFGIIVGALSGVLLGVGVSRVFSLEALTSLSNKVYAVLIAVFTAPIIIGFLFIIRHPGI